MKYKGYNPPITEKTTRKILRQEFSNAKKTLDPMFKDFTFSSIKFFWMKRDGHVLGQCWKYTKLIYLNPCYKNELIEEQMRKTIRHEYVHLINKKRGHGLMFRHLLASLNQETHLRAPAYKLKDK